MYSRIIFALILFSVGNNQLFAQKIGHVNRQEILQVMPQFAMVSKTLDSLSSQKDAYYQQLALKYQKEKERYQSIYSTLGQAERNDIAEDLMAQEKRIQSYSQQAQNDLVQKQNELLEPVIELLNKTIGEVAKENGYAYVVDTEVLIYSPTGSDITALVKKKLNIPANATPYKP